MSKNIYLNRIGFCGELNELCQIVCAEFNLGKYLNSQIITIGYEDFNCAVTTSNEKYLIKIFSEERSLDECRRLIEVMVSIMNKQIQIPQLKKSSQGYLHILQINNKTLRICVMDYVLGKDLFHLNLKLDLSQIKQLIEQVAKINSLTLKPSLVYDSWAIPNFLKEFKEKSSYLNSEDLILLNPLVQEFAKLKLDNLPHAFVHGDIISTNVIKDNLGYLWIIDLSCANCYPRIQELAVLACDILFDPNNPKKTEEMLNFALGIYQSKISLTSRELEVLPFYIKLAHAMHLLCANFEKKAKNNSSKENEYFLNLGRAGLLQSLSHFNVKTKLKSLIHHPYLDLVLRGNSAITSALSLLPKDKILLIPEEGGWIHYYKAPEKLKLKSLKIKCNDAKIDLVDLEEKLSSHKISALLYQNPGGYFAEQPVKEIYSLCKKYTCLVILDVSGAIGTKLCKSEFADILIGSFGEGKLVEAGGGGFISTKDEKIWNLLLPKLEVLTDSNSLEKIETALAQLPQRIKFLQHKKTEIINDLTKFKEFIVHPKDLGFVLVIKYNKESQKEKLIHYCESKKLPFNLCPRYIRLNQPAVCIEIKQLN